MVKLSNKLQPNKILLPLLVPSSRILEVYSHMRLLQLKRNVQRAVLIIISKMLTGFMMK